MRLLCKLTVLISRNKQTGYMNGSGALKALAEMMNRGSGETICAFFSLSLFPLQGEVERNDET